MNQPPPLPPADTQHSLAKLKQYYQELIAYHSVALEEAKRMLSHTEVLMSVLREPMEGRQLQNVWQEPNVLPQPHEGSVPLQTEYAHLTLEQAINRVLEESRGEVVHVDYLVRELYGSLSDSELERAKIKVEAALWQGKLRGDWDAYPDSPECYTIDLSLPGLAPKGAASASKSPRPPSLPTEVKMKPKYYRESFGKSVQAVLEATKKPMTVREVARELFEEFAPKHWEPARRVTGSALIKAYEREDIQRVSKGEYRCL